ncbi:MAG: DNA recombination protein RmuC [Bacteroidales bacterium]|nr:DNA recombination protein RmuC [Bacteroidales bacterium]
MVTYILIGVLIVVLIVFVFYYQKQFEKVLESIQRIDTLQRDEFARNRDELQKSLKDNRLELGQNMTQFKTELSQQFTLNKDDIHRQLEMFQKTLIQSFQDFNTYHAQKFSDLVRQYEQMRQDTEHKLEKVRETVEKKLESIQQENNKKLEEMRATVDEKLHNTLEKRLNDSFKLVSERLEQVHKGLGEMQSLASNVSDLKKVLSNVKQRGILGEIQLGAILENILSPEQYDKNIATKPHSREVVEYAIILPGKDEQNKPVYLPIDSKFPLDVYHHLLDAYENGDSSDIQTHRNLLTTAIKNAAKDINQKYIYPPHTTDFAIMFLPFEGLYAEVVRDSDLLRELQQTYHIIVAGPSTLAALLNSLQMGFRTLAIEKRSTEVWKLLQAVKTEFSNFEKVLNSAKDKIEKAGEEIEKLVGTRTRKINAKLKNIEALPESEAKKVLDITETTSEWEDDDVVN